MNADASPPTNADDGERFTTPGADRAPTPDEAAAAERAAAGVDLEDVAARYEEMIERGAHVKGEGQIEPE